jgi:hypothetical protein
VVFEGLKAPYGKTDQEMFEIDTGGLEPAWTQLLASCPAAPNSARPVMASPGPASAPGQRARAMPEIPENFRSGETRI